MSIRANSNYAQQEEDGETELVLVALTYTGSRSMYSAQGMRNEGGYPALDSFRGPGPGDDEGETKLVYLPSQRLGWWENHADFEVSYEPETMARSLLRLNYIPEQIVGPNYDKRAREDLTEQLGLDPFANESDLREQLRDVAGFSEEEKEADEAAVPDEPDTRVDSLVSHGRSVLIKVANSYDDIDDLLEAEDKNSVSHLGQTDLAGFLAEKDDDEVDKRIATAEQGGEL